MGTARRLNRYAKGKVVFHPLWGVGKSYGSAAGWTTVAFKAGTFQVPTHHLSLKDKP